MPDDEPPEYVPRDVDTAEHGVRAKASVAIASNESFSGWTKAFTDPRLCAGAMLETCGSAGKGASVKEGVPSRLTES